MDKITVAELKEKLQEYIDILEQYDDDMKVPTSTNTYFMNSSFWMQFGRIGFVDLGCLDENLSEQEDEDDDEGEE